MNPINDGFALWHLPHNELFNFRLVIAGHLQSLDGCHYCLGGYVCWHVVKRGHGTVRCGRRSASVGPGDMFTLQEECQLEYFDDPADPWEFYYLHFEGPAATAMTRQAGFQLARPWLRPRQPEIVLRHFQHLWKMVQQPEEWQVTHLNLEVLKLLDLLSSAVGRIVRSPETLVRQAERLANDPGYAAVNVAELARALQMDRGTLHRAFCQVTGEAPGVYLRRRRLARARELLLSHPELSVAEIAGAGGFDNEKYFIRAFRHEYQLSPGRFRRESAGTAPAPEKTDV